MKPVTPWLLFAVALQFSSAAATADSDSGCADSPTATTIEDQRAAFNAAIAAGDAAAVGEFLAGDVVLVAGTHSDRFLGREEQVRIWEEDFADSDRLVYVRTPVCIVTSAVTDMAMEEGRWRGSNAGGEFAEGRYSAKWRLIDGAWRLEAEIFMTEACEGDFCPAP